MTAYATPPTAVAGQNLSAANWNAKVRDSMEAVAKVPRCRMRRTTNLAVPNGSVTQVPFDATDVNTDSIWSLGNPTRFTAPVAGLFLASAGGQFAINATGARMLFLQRNGANIMAMNHTIGNAVWYTGGMVSTPVVLAAGDYMEFMVYQTSGGSLNLDTTSYPIWASLVLMSY